MAVFRCFCKNICFSFRVDDLSFDGLFVLADRIDDGVSTIQEIHDLIVDRIDVLTIGLHRIHSGPSLLTISSNMA